MPMPKFQQSLYCLTSLSHLLIKQHARPNVTWLHQKFQKLMPVFNSSQTIHLELLKICSKDQGFRWFRLYFSHFSYIKVPFITLKLRSWGEGDNYIFFHLVARRMHINGPKPSHCMKQHSNYMHFQQDQNLGCLDIILNILPSYQNYNVMVRVESNSFIF